MNNLFASEQDDNFLITVVKEREDELTKKTLQALNDMRIKFPGKTDQEAELILDTVSYTPYNAPHYKYFDFSVNL